MTVLTEAKLAEWCQGPFWQGPDHVNFDGKEFFFSHPEAACIYLKPPGALDGLPCFIRAIATGRSSGRRFSRGPDRDDPMGHLELRSRRAIVSSNG